MSRHPWMPLYVADFEADTIDLEADEVGVYFKLLCLAWQRNGSFPADEIWLRKVLKRLFADFHGHTYNRIVPKLLARFFILEDGLYTNKRLTKEKQKADKISANQKQKADKRWGKSKENNDLADAVAMPSTTTIQSHNKEESKKEKRARPVPLPDDWQPSEKSYRLAEQFGQNVQIVEGIFRDYCASSGKLYADHDAAFHNFIRNQKTFNRGSVTNGKPPSSIIQAADNLCRKLADFDGSDREVDELRSGEGKNPPRLLSHG